MTQAIEILNKFSKRHESAYGFNGEMMASLGDINDAIKELEAPKTCNGCKHYVAEDLYMGYCNEILTDVNSKWGCISYKPKEPK